MLELAAAKNDQLSLRDCFVTKTAPSFVRVCLVILSARKHMESSALIGSDYFQNSGSVT